MRSDRGTENTIIGTLQQFFRCMTMTILQEVEVSSKAKAPKINALKPGGLNFERVEGVGG